MFGSYQHSIFNHEIKIEPLSFYGCYENFAKSPLMQVSTPLMQGSTNRQPSNLHIPMQEPKEEPPSQMQDMQPVEVNVKLTGKQQSCKVCGKILSSSSSYYVHMKQHSNSKPYQCNDCDASFCRKPYLEVHMRTHTGEKPFECEICKKRFTQKSSLNTHKRVHTGERPYVCDICNKSFAVKSYLQAHNWSHMKGEGLACTQCNILFHSKAQYIQHTRSHTGRTKNYNCMDCKKSFVKESFLIRHMNRVHKGLEPGAPVINHQKRLPINTVNMEHLSMGGMPNMDRVPIMGHINHDIQNSYSQTSISSSSEAD